LFQVKIDPVIFRPLGKLQRNPGRSGFTLSGFVSLPTLLWVWLFLLGSDMLLIVKITAVKRLY